jgi:hypothetical protein
MPDPSYPDDLPPDGQPPDEGGDELFESERNLERVLDYLDLMNATDIEQTGSFEEDNQAVAFSIVASDPPQPFSGFACYVRDAYVDVCLARDWSPDIRLKFRTRAGEIMNTLGLQGVSVYFMPDEDTLYLSHRVFSEGLNFDVFRACIWSLLSAQGRVASILEQER